jgi:ureidoglycolate lyase
MSTTGARIVARPLTADAFAPFGDVLDAHGAPDFPINAGQCDRFHDRARLEFLGEGARAGISLARSRPSALPLRLERVERHPLGSQAFLPLGADPFLVVVAPDADGVPEPPLAFLTRPGQGVNYLRNVWHGALAPLGRSAGFVIVDRIAPSGDPAENLREWVFATPFEVEAA